MNMTEQIQAFVDAVAKPGSFDDRTFEPKVAFVDIDITEDASEARIARKVQNSSADYIVSTPHGFHLFWLGVEPQPAVLKALCVLLEGDLAAARTGYRLRAPGKNHRLLRVPRS